MLVRDLITQLMFMDPDTLVVVPRDVGVAPYVDLTPGHFRPHNASGGWFYTEPRADTIPCIAIA